MTKRLLLLIGILTTAAAVTVVGAVAARVLEGAQQAPPEPAFRAPVDVDTTGLPGPVQPVFYRHDVHAGEYQMDCRYCHFAAETSTSAGMPTMSTCMGCHIIAGSGNPEVQKLRDAWNERRPIEWVEVHVLPPFVRFPHHRHVNSEQGSFGELAPIDKCQECHGPIQEMPQVYRFASLKMGWCVTCHEAQDVTTDCTACHY